MKYIISLYVCFNILIAQEHLEPEMGIYSLSAYKFEYYGAFLNSMTRGMDELAVAKVICIPFGEKEWVVSLEKIGNRYYVLTSEPEIGLGINGVEDPKNKLKRIASIKIIKHKKEIESNLAETLSKIFIQMTSDTRYPKDEAGGLDGTNYHFLTFNHFIGLRTGRIWSPKLNSKTGKLAKLSNMLFEFAHSSKNDVQQIEMIKDNCRDFLK